MIPLLIAIPAVLAVLFQFVRNEKARGYIVYAGSGIIMLTTVIFIVRWVTGGAQTWMLYPETELIDHLMTAGDIFLMCLIIYLSVKHEKVIPIILSVLQTALVIYTEFTADVAEGPHMMDGIATRAMSSNGMLYSSSGVTMFFIASMSSSTSVHEM